MSRLIKVCQDGRIYELENDSLIKVTNTEGQVEFLSDAVQFTKAKNFIITSVEKTLLTTATSRGQTKVINQERLNLIKAFEGLYLEAYPDPIGIWTIGYGHIEKVTKGMKITVALVQAIQERNRTLRVNSAYRTLVQQRLLYGWREGRGGCHYGLVAPPGRSNHQGGLAIDINDHLGWRPFLERYGWKRFGNADKPHFTYVGSGTKDIRNYAIKAFQRLYNRNNPSNKILEDGIYGNNTEAKINLTSVKGFKIAPWDTQPRILRFSRPMSEGSDVLKVQQALKVKGFNLVPDGLFVEGTASIVKQFQEREGLVPDGIVGSKTLEKLFA